MYEDDVFSDMEATVESGGCRKNRSQ